MKNDFPIIRNHSVMITLKGNVSRIRRLKNEKISRFYLLTNDSEVECTCGFFCPVHEGDIVIGTATLNNSVWDFDKPPFVTIPKTRESILKYFKKALGYRITTNSIEFYSLLEKVHADQSNIFNYICILSSEYCTNGNTKVFDQYCATIAKEDLRKILVKWNKDVNLRRLYLLGFTNREIYSVGLGPLALYERCINEGPIQFPQISMERCTDILERLDKTLSDDEFACGMLAREVNGNAMNSGWVYTPIDKLKVVYDGAGNSKISRFSPSLEEKYGVSMVGNNFFVSRYYNANLFVAVKIMELLKLEFEEAKEINYENKELDDQQRSAVKLSLNGSLTVITGFAGTGKTTVIKEIVCQFRKRNLTFCVLSFTGKAVSRINEILEDAKAMTIHLFLKNETDKLDYVLIDEISTVNTELLSKLMKHFKILPKFVFVGDKNQLPPIECGNLLQEILTSTNCKLKNRIIHLDKVYRVRDVKDADGNIVDGILKNSMELAKGGSIITRCANFQIMPGTEKTVLNIAKALHAQGISKMDFIILSPYNRCLKSLNEECQSIYCSESFTKDSLDRKWYIGDKVMMTVNNYKINVMNGEEGVVTDIYKDRVKIKFNEEHLFNTMVKQKEFNQLANEELSSTEEDDLDVGSLIHSYAITIHKSQGSEWNYVILYIEDGATVNRNFLNRSLFYTAITRSRICVWIVSDFSTVNEIASTSKSKQYDNLKDLLKMEE